MIRISRLLNRAVICSNKQIGFLQSVVLDGDQKRVEALIVARGLRGKCVVPEQAITVISEEFILVSSMRKYGRDDERKNPCFIRDTSGLLIGRVTDYALDENTLQIQAIEIIRGYLPDERRTKIWLFTYAISENHPGELVVPLIQGLESIEWKEENTCECRQ